LVLLGGHHCCSSNKGFVVVGNLIKQNSKYLMVVFASLNFVEQGINIIERNIILPTKIQKCISFYRLLRFEIGWILRELKFLIELFVRILLVVAIWLCLITKKTVSAVIK
jgi:hypothetical protein